MKKLAEYLKDRPEGLTPLELRGLLTDYDLLCVRRYNTPELEDISDAVRRTDEFGLGSDLIPDSIDNDGYLFIEVEGEPVVSVGFEDGRYKSAFYHLKLGHMHGNPPNVRQFDMKGNLVRRSRELTY